MKKARDDLIFQMVLGLSRGNFANAFLITIFRVARLVNWCFFDFTTLNW